MSMMFAKLHKSTKVCNRLNLVKVKIVLLVGFIWLLSGCATEANYQRKLDRFIGMSKQELIEEWGKPLTVFEHKEMYNSSGKLLQKEETIINYSKSYTVTTPAKLTVNQVSKNTTTYDIQPESTTRFSCMTTFRLEKDRVVSYTYKGNDCVAYSFF